MEIHTHNLLAFSLQEDRLQNNFLNIAATLAQMQAQLNALSKHQEMLSSSGETKQKQIDDLYSIHAKQVSAINRHEQSIELLNSQLNSFGFAAEEDSRQSTPEA
jgi:response regulator of citrate/malate metabolism